TRPRDPRSQGGAAAGVRAANREARLARRRGRAVPPLAGGEARGAGAALAGNARYPAQLVLAREGRREVEGHALVRGAAVAAEAERWQVGERPRERLGLPPRPPGPGRAGDEAEWE